MSASNTERLLDNVCALGYRSIDGKKQQIYHAMHERNRTTGKRFHIAPNKVAAKRSSNDLPIRFRKFEQFCAVVASDCDFPGEKKNTHTKTCLSDTVVAEITEGEKKERKVSCQGAAGPKGAGIRRRQNTRHHALLALCDALVVGKGAQSLVCCHLAERRNAADLRATLRNISGKKKAAAHADLCIA